MRSKVKAQIRWIPADKGGRNKPPVGPSYSTVAKFEDIQEKWPAEAWSVVLEFIDPPDQSGFHCADMRFLVDNAPQQLLHDGSKFELFEGPKRVATGEVVNE